MRKKPFIVCILLALCVLVLTPLSVPAQLTTTRASSIRLSATVPATCNVGDVFFRTATTIGLYECTAANTWTYIGAASITTPVTVANGGTGLATLTANTIYRGNGSSAIATTALTDDGTTVGSSRPLSVSANGAASTPAITGTGTWFSGGSATTTKPSFLIEPAGTTSTAWSTGGTGIGINAPSGFTGNLFDAKTNSSATVRVYADQYGETYAPAFVLHSGNINIGSSSGSKMFLASAAAIMWNSDLHLSRSAAGVLRVGTNSENADGSVLLTNLTGTGFNSSAIYKTATNCADSAGAAACGAAAAGAVVIDAAATTVVVSTTAVTATSRILIQEDSSLGTELGITCNATPQLNTVTARTAATSFTITTAIAPVTNPRCYNYWVVN